MTSKPADIFCQHDNIESFKECLMELNGEFLLEKDEMIKLGEEYFKRYPDTFSRRNYDNIHTGYKLTRICMLEKMMCGFPPVRQKIYRTCFDNIKIIRTTIPQAMQTEGEQAIKEEIIALEQRILGMNKQVETLPTGMVKERYVGGIAHFYNVIYLMKMAAGLTE